MPTTIEQVLPSSGRVPGAAPIFASPFQTLLTGDDHLRIQAYGSVAVLALEIGYRFREPGGTVIANTHHMTVTGDRLVNVQTLTLAPGYLLNLAVRCLDVSIQWGQVYVVVDLVRGAGEAFTQLGQLLGGYVNVRVGLAWPGSPVKGPIEGPGGIRALPMGTVASTILASVPTNAYWRPISAVAGWTASAVAATRTIVFAIGAGGGEVYKAICPVPLTAGVRVDFTLGEGVPWSSAPAATGIDATGYGPIPRQHYLRRNESVKFNLINPQAGDISNGGRLMIEEWIEAAL